jgi:hypothetical protein
MTSFSDTDPASLTPGIVKITNSVPNRNGVRKSGVVDGPIRGKLVDSQSVKPPMMVIQSAREMILLSSAEEPYSANGETVLR